MYFLKERFFTCSTLFCVLGNILGNKLLGALLRLFLVRTL